MAVENLKSTYITNATATPIVITNGGLAHARLHEGTGTVLTDVAASATSTYRMCRVPSNARVSQVLLSNTATTAGATDIGIYQTGDNGGAVVDAALFASAASLISAQNNVDVTYESGGYTLAESEKMLWQVLGLTADSQREYDVVMTLTTAVSTTAVTANVKVRYTK